MTLTNIQGRLSNDVENLTNVRGKLSNDPRNSNMRCEGIVVHTELRNDTTFR